MVEMVEMAESSPLRLAWSRRPGRLTTVVLACALFLVAAASSLAGCDRGAPGLAIDGPAAHALVTAGATLVDVRTPAEWSDGHATGAVLIPISELGSRLGEIPRGHPVVVYCASGVRSARAATMLAAAGYTVRDLGSLARWNQ